VSAVNYARAERAALADLLEQVGPDQPTLCTGWTTRDLAAHLVVRDRRPDAAAGIVLPFLSGHTDRVRDAAARRDFATLVDQVRRPPKLTMAGFGPTDRATNTSEFFIHHEDVRRAAVDWSPRELDPGLAARLGSQARLLGRLRLRRFPAALTIAIAGQPTVTTGRGGPAVTLSGDPDEITLFLSGRQAHARVTVDGPDEPVERLRKARLGL
jgi:uncharacterized protein (TIGR03085 family)